VNGGWGNWSEWEECPVSCGGADQRRTRACDTPTPEFGGDDCTVDGSTNSETQRCNENSCLGK
jgi:thrombospondin 1